MLPIIAQNKKNNFFWISNYAPLMYPNNQIWRYNILHSAVHIHAEPRIHPKWPDPTRSPSGSSFKSWSKKLRLINKTKKKTVNVDPDPAIDKICIYLDPKSTKMNRGMILVWRKKIYLCIFKGIHFLIMKKTDPDPWH